MEQISQVEAVFHRAIQVFAKDPYVSAIFLFGSYEKRIHDCYSDVDLHVVSQNFDATMSQFSYMLSEIGPVLVAFPLTTHVGYAAYMVLFENYPLYTKLDINISDSQNGALLAEKTCVYQRDVIPASVVSTFSPTLFEEPFHTIYGYYLGAIRYMKYRKRGKHFSAYKFYRAQLDYILLRWYREISQEGSRERLGILEYQALDMHEESAVLKLYLYPENECAMDRFYLELLRRMTRELELCFDEKHERVLGFILGFLVQEVGG